jgi:hypothetical protein
MLKKKLKKESPIKMKENITFQKLEGTLLAWEVVVQSFTI